MNKEFKEKFETFIAEFPDRKNMVLSTSYNDEVTSRMMSVIQIDGNFYFQTDIQSRKAQQIRHNKNVSLCMDNVQIDGVCEMIGTPAENLKFLELFSKYFNTAYNLYTKSENERLFVIKPVKIYKWVYQNNKPFTEFFDIKEHTFNRIAYL